MSLRTCEVSEENAVLWELCENDELGRHLLATDNIAAGQIILRESPLVIVPSPTPQIDSFFCLSCYQEIYTGDETYHSKEENDSRAVDCPGGCGLWMCDSDKCKANRSAHDEECFLCRASKKGTSKIQEKFQNFKKFPQISEWYGTVVGILRVLGLRRTKPDIFDKLMQFKYHDALSYQNFLNEPFLSSRKIIDLPSVNHLKSIVQLTTEFLQEIQEDQDEDIDEDLIWKIGNIILTNGYNLPGNDRGERKRARTQGLYNTASFMEHNCRPNCIKSWDSVTNSLIIRSAVNIKRGDHLSISYVDPLWGSSDRHNFLLRTASFVCECGRCSDPTELGSHLSSIRCQSKACSSRRNEASRSIIGIGFLVPMDPLNPQSHWQCLSCFTIQSPEFISSIIQEIGVEAENISKSRVSQSLEREEGGNGNGNGSIKDHEGMGIAVREEFIQKYSEILHPNHFFLLHFKIELAQLYPSDESALKISTLVRKRNLCIQILGVLDIICPGCTRLGTLIVNELHSTDATLKKIKEILGQLQEEAKLGNLCKMIQPSSWESELSLDTQRRVKKAVRNDRRK